MKIGGSIVTLYSTLGEEALVYCLNQTELTTVACDSKPFDIIVQAKQDFKIPIMKNILTFFTPSDS